MARRATKVAEGWKREVLPDLTNLPWERSFRKSFRVRALRKHSNIYVSLRHRKTSREICEVAAPSLFTGPFDALESDHIK